MNRTVVVWIAVVIFLAVKSFRRPSYAVALYMVTFLVHPQFWWWGDIVEGYRWNFYAGNLLLGTLVLTGSLAAITRDRPINTNAVPFLALMALNATVVHLVLAVNPDSSLQWLTSRLKFILLFFMLQYAIKDEEDFRVVALSMLFGMGYIGYEATINERGSFSGGRLEGIGAAGVTSSNQLASLLITALPVAATVLFTAVRPWLKVLTVVLGGFIFNVVLMCNSRGALLGILIGGVAFALLASGPARRQSKRLVALGAIGTFLLLGDPEIIQRFMTIFSGEAQRDSSAQNRIVFWTAAREMAAEYPLGSGGNSFSEGRGWRYLASARSRSRMQSADDVVDTRAIHNGFLTELVDWGVQGLLIMLLFLYAVWRTIHRGRRLALEEHDVNAVMTFALLAMSLVAWLVSSFFGDYLNDEWGFWTAAMTYAYLRVRMLSERQDAIPANQAARTAPAVTPAVPRNWAT